MKLELCFSPFRSQRVLLGRLHRSGVKIQLDELPGEHPVAAEGGGVGGRGDGMEGGGGVAITT